MSIQILDHKSISNIDWQHVLKRPVLLAAVFINMINKNK